MPATYRFDLTNRLVYSYAWGVLTGEELVAHARHLPTDLRFDPGFRQLQELSEVTSFAVTTAQLRLTAGLNVWGAGARRAVVVSGRAPFDLARQYEMMRVNAADEYRVFQDIAAAATWLGLPADWEPPAASPDDPVFDFPPPSAPAE